MQIVVLAACVRCTERSVQTLGMTYMGLVKIFKGDFADMCSEKFPQVSMGYQAEGQVCKDPPRRQPK